MTAGNGRRSDGHAAKGGAGNRRSSRSGGANGHSGNGAGPAEVDGLPVEGTWRSHQVPLPAVRDNPDHLRQLEEWLRSYRPRELFDEHGVPRPDVLTCIPEGARRLGSTPYANGGLLVRELPLPPLERYAVPVDKPGSTLHEPTRVLGDLLEDVMRGTADRRDFRRC